jgi:hypothetical protein
MRKVAELFDNLKFELVAIEKEFKNSSGKEIGERTSFSN